MKITLSHKAVCFIPHTGITTVLVPMVTRHIAVCFENYSFAQSRLFHSVLWNHYSSGFYRYQAVFRKLHFQTKSSGSFRTLQWVVSMVTTHMIVCYENWGFRQNLLFHSQLWNNYSSGLYSNLSKSSVSLRNRGRKLLNSAILDSEPNLQKLKQWWRNIIFTRFDLQIKLNIYISGVTTYFLA